MNRHDVGAAAASRGRAAPVVMSRIVVTLGAVLVLAGAAFAALLVIGPQDVRERWAGGPPQAAMDGGEDGGAGASSVPATNAIAEQAAAWGVEQCAREVALVSDFLTRNAAFAARPMRGPHDPDREVFSATIVARGHDGLESMSTMMVAPVTAGRCNVVYETTSYFEVDCDAARQTWFANFANPVAFGGRARVYGTAGNDGQLYMLPAGGGCLVKKSQVLY